MDGGLDEAAMEALREHLGPQHRGKMLFQMGPNGMAQPLGIAGGVPGAEAEGPEPELKLGDPAVVHSLKAAAGHNGTQMLLRQPHRLRRGLYLASASTAPGCGRAAVHSTGSARLTAI